MLFHVDKSSCLQLWCITSNYTRTNELCYSVPMYASTVLPMTHEHIPWILTYFLGGVFWFFYVPEIWFKNDTLLNSLAAVGTMFAYGLGMY